MNARIFAAALIATASLASASAFADTQTADAGQTAPSVASQGLTRAQVIEELRQARASGQLDQSLETYPSLLQQRTSVGRSRAQVRSEIGTTTTASDNRA